jgi:superfamily II DNA or RNA helicase
LTTQTIIASGARLEIRDAEWIVRRADSTSTGGKSLLVAGVSEIVRGREARFLTEIEGKSLRVLDPAETKLVLDPSPQFSHTRLYLESLLRMTPPTDTNLWIGHRAAVDDLPYQLDPALQALAAPRPRILMADAVGLGKTIECGILLSELIKRGRARRILVVTVKSMMTQFQTELWSRFTIPLVRLDSAGLDRIRNRIPSNANPFHYYDRTIISIDTLKQQNEFRVYLENCRWDVIVIDEAHNVARRGNSASDRSKLAELLATRSDALILTSATPHDGKAASFASLMNMLNPTAIADPNDYGPEDIKGLYVRRFKHHIREQIQSSLHERRVVRTRTAASPAEETAFAVLAGMKAEAKQKGVRRTGQFLFVTVLEKALFSSPAACRKSIEVRLKKLGEGLTTETERAGLERLDTALASIAIKDFSKYQELLSALKPAGALDWRPENVADRVVIFTERIETVKFLRDNLQRDLSLRADQIAILHGSGQDDIDVQGIVKEFGRDRSPIRLLIASDIASEGINLHFLSHKLIHFDIPWSLMVFQQRNGRVDRYGQERQPIITYLCTEPTNPTVRGDLRILELLIEKDTQAQKNIGDPSAFFGVYDESEEEQVTGRAIEDSVTPEVFEKRLEQTKEDDPLAFLDAAPPPSGSTARNCKRDWSSLFGSDIDYMREGLRHIDPRNDLQLDYDPESQMLSITVDNDLRRAFRLLPPDVVPENDRIHLTADRALVKKAIKDCRGSVDGEWPKIHLLWDLHPVVDWLNFKLLVSFGRHQAPIVPIPNVLSPGELFYLMESEIPNRKGQPVIHEWCAVRFQDKRAVETLTLGEFLERTQFHRRQYPNTGLQPNQIPLDQLREDAVLEARRWMSNRRTEFENRMRPAVNDQLRKLSELRAKQVGFVESTFADRKRDEQKRDEKLRAIDKVFLDYQDWIRDTMTTQDQPYIRIAAVFAGADR